MKKTILFILFLIFSIVPVFSDNQLNSEEPPATYISTDIFGPLLGLYTLELEREINQDWGYYFSASYVNIKYGLIGPAYIELMKLLIPDAEDELDQLWNSFDMWMAAGALGGVKYIDRDSSGIFYGRGGVTAAYGEYSISIIEPNSLENLKLTMAVTIMSLNGSIGKKFIFNDTFVVDLFASLYAGIVLTDYSQLFGLIGLSEADASQMGFQTNFPVNAGASVSIRLQLKL